MQHNIIAILGHHIILVQEKNSSQWRLPQENEIASNAAVGEIFKFTHPAPVIIMRIDACPDGMVSMELRKAWQLIGNSSWGLAAKGMELLLWSESMHYCSRCGAALKRSGEICFSCPECGREEWPRLNPAIMVLVKRGEEALLVHGANFRSNACGLVAGFVETGETLEQCVMREVKEETSLSVTNIRYFDSQSWPFPASLMIGFTADYVSGSLTFADGELDAGGFYTRNNHPEIVTPPSLANKMITAWLEGEI